MYRSSDFISHKLKNVIRYTSKFDSSDARVTEPEPLPQSYIRHSRRRQGCRQPMTLVTRSFLRTRTFPQHSPLEPKNAWWAELCGGGGDFPYHTPAIGHVRPSYLIAHQIGPVTIPVRPSPRRKRSQMSHTSTFLTTSLIQKALLPPLFPFFSSLTITNDTLLRSTPWSTRIYPRSYPSFRVCFKRSSLNSSREDS